MKSQKLSELMLLLQFEKKRAQQQYHQDTHSQVVLGHNFQVFNRWNEIHVVVLGTTFRHNLLLLLRHLPWDVSIFFYNFASRSPILMNHQRKFPKSLVYSFSSPWLLPSLSFHLLTLDTVHVRIHIFHHLFVAK